MNATQERWLPIPGYEGFYEVSDLGRVKSLTRTISTGPGTTGPRVWPERILRSEPAANGYLYVSLRRDGKKPQRTVHSFVMEAFVGPHPGPGFHVCHGNGVRSDNRLGNLRYDTEAANHADTIMHGTSLRGERQPAHRLTEDEVREIRRRYAAGGVLQKQLAAEYGVGKVTIHHVVHRTTWAWLD